MEQRLRLLESVDPTRAVRRHNVEGRNAFLIRHEGKVSVAEGLSAGGSAATQGGEGVAHLVEHRAAERGTLAADGVRS